MDICMHAPEGIELDVFILRKKSRSSFFFIH
jgi:hypothetical protein